MTLYYPFQNSRHFNFENKSQIDKKITRAFFRHMILNLFSFSTSVTKSGFRIPRPSNSGPNLRWYFTLQIKIFHFKNKNSWNLILIPLDFEICSNLSFSSLFLSLVITLTNLLWGNGTFALRTALFKLRFFFYYFIYFIYYYDEGTFDRWFARKRSRRTH